MNLDGLINGAVGGLLGGLMSLTGLWVKERFDRKREVRTKAEAEKERYLRSDAACWREVRPYLAKLWWETINISASNVVEPSLAWAASSADLVQAIASVSFHDAELATLVAEVQLTAGKLANAVRRAETWRKRALEATQALSPRDRDLGHEAIIANEEAQKWAFEISRLVQRLNDEVRVRVGFDRVLFM